MLDDCDKYIQCDRGVAVDPNGETCDLRGHDFNFDFRLMACVPYEYAHCFQYIKFYCYNYPWYHRVPDRGWSVV
jgi:hypothetical protein